MRDQPDYGQAKKRVQKLKGFHQHLMTFVIINVLLLIINLITTPGTLWFHWPLLAWGIGIFFHAYSVYGRKKLKTSLRTST